MGVTGLLPFLKKSTDPVNLSQLSGMTAAIDAYVWLHRGAFSCADKLIKGENTTAYIGYGLKMLHLLLSYNIKPILVFDGRRLEAKKDTESKRYEQRKLNRKKADELARAGRERDALEYYRRCVDINHNMAIQFIRAARNMKIDCIVAPHEADAQLAYLNQQGLAQVIITEDSDLILFGCTQILYKLDINGNGMLLRLDRLNESLGRPNDLPQHLLPKLRQICILSGCDYVNSLPGIGLGKAKKFIMATADPDLCNSVKRLPLFLNLRVKIEDGYIDRLKHAELTFTRQLVFDPRSRKQLPLDGKEITESEPYSGECLDTETALHLAVGNLDPSNLHTVDDFDPDTLPVTSIWHKHYQPPKSKEETRTNAFVITKGKQVIVETKKVTAIKRPKIVELSDEEVANLYTVKTTERFVAKSEVKTNLSDGKQVICSSYFTEKSTTRRDSTVVQSNEKLSTTPRKLNKSELFPSVDNFPEEKQKSPQLTSSQIMTIINESPSKVTKDLSPMKNPFSKNSSPRKKKPRPPLINILDDCDSNVNESKVETESSKDEEKEMQVDENSPSTNESIYSDAQSDFQSNSSVYETPSSDFSQSQNPSQQSNSSALNRFKLSRPLFTKTLTTVEQEIKEEEEISIETSYPKSPVFGKRKRDSASSPANKKITSRYEKGLFSPAKSTNDGSVITVTTKRNLSTSFQWSNKPEDTNAPPPSVPSSLTNSTSNSKLSKIPKLSGQKTRLNLNQTKLFNFGFHKK